MAVGDHTIDDSFPRSMGNMWMLSGTVEVDDTIRAYAISDTKSRMVNMQLVDDDGVGVPWCAINENASGTETMGTVAIAGNHQSVDTYRYLLYYV